MCARHVFLFFFGFLNTEFRILNPTGVWGLAPKKKFFSRLVQ